MPEDVRLAFRQKAMEDQVTGISPLLNKTDASPILLNQILDNLGIVGALGMTTELLRVGRPGAVALPVLQRVFREAAR